MKAFIALTCLLALSYASSASAATTTCNFEIVVQTGNRDDAGTDSRISLKVSGASGPTLSIQSLKPWGKMGAGHNYFERGNTDRFEGKGECLRGGPCKMLLTTDGKGNKPGWYVNFVQVTQLGPGASSTRKRWAVNKWLALDENPNSLTVSKDDC